MQGTQQLLCIVDTHHEWILEHGPGLLYDTGLNPHLSDRGGISPGRVQDSDGARTIIVSFHHLAGLVAATTKHKYTRIREADINTWRLLLSANRPDGS